METKKDNIRSTLWRGLFLLTIFVPFAYVFLEWLFVVTKPSFMTNISWLLKVEILLFFSASAISLSLIVIGCFYLVAKNVSGIYGKKLVFKIASIIPAAILASLILILIDNFTYTLFDYGIIKTKGFMRGIYALGFLVTIFLFHRESYNWCLKIGKSILKSIAGSKIAIGVCAFLLFFILVPLIRTGTKLSSPRNLIPMVERYSLPNIVLITSDGLNSDHMSVYGYEKDTTPFLKEMADNSLIVENNFNNNAKTGGSIISILTGKYPSTTRVVFSPDILRNEDSYQHLPGLLNTIGYHTAQFGGDALNFNLLQGYDEINGSSTVSSNILDSIDDYIPGDYAYFTYEVLNRIIDRLRHIFFVKKMDDSILHLTDWDGNYNDYENLNKFFALIEHTDSPLFVQMHWFGTHGDYFKVRNQVFSNGKDPDNQEAWDLDFYDDAILEFDDVLRGIEEKLYDFGKLNNTIIVVGSDHGQYWKVNERIPLIFLFPEGEYAQKIIYNGQNLDIAPTLLDYLGIGKPTWMKGNSLLDGIDRQRLILSFDLGVTMEGEFGVSKDPDYSIPPFYQFGKVSVIDCDRFYSLSLRNGFDFQKQLVDGYETPCDYVSNSDTQILQFMIEHLKENKFDISSLEAWMEGYSNP